MVWGGRTRWVEVRSRHSVPGTWGRRGFAEGWPVGLGNEGTELGRPRGCGLSRKLQGAGVGRSPPELSSRREHGVCHGPVPPERPVTSVLAAHAPPCGGGAEPFCSAFARPRLARRAGLSIPGAEGSGATGGTPGERPPLSPEASPALPCCFQQVPVLDSSRLPAPAPGSCSAPGAQAGWRGHCLKRIPFHLLSRDSKAPLSACPTPSCPLWQSGLHPAPCPQWATASGRPWLCR